MRQRYRDFFLTGKAANKVRIGGGEWRSRVLHFPESLGLRPTPDRVRETAFNWLGQALTGLHCLDLFAGSGALGFEALSRGASSAVLVEQNPAVYRALQQNAGLLKADRARIVRQDALGFLAGDCQRYDVIFLDPPFGQHWLARLLPLMPTRLNVGGVLYVEAEAAIDAPVAWRLLKQGRAGNVCYHLLELAHEQESDLSGHL